MGDWFESALSVLLLLAAVAALSLGGFCIYKAVTTDSGTTVTVSIPSGSGRR